MEKRINRKEIVFAGLIYALVFQSPLEVYVWDKFSYIDECVALIGGIAFIYIGMNNKIEKISKETYLIVFALIVFGIIGLLGNLIYQYQPWKAVVVDFVTNFKFFFAILAGYFLFADVPWEDMKKCVNSHCRCITLLLGTLFLIDRIFNIFPGHVRYGIKSNTLFYRHPTYVVGAIVFLIVLQIIFYEGKNIPYLVFNIIMLVFTMRFKAMATAAVFIVLFIHVILLKKRITKRHWALLGAIILVIGMPMIYFYYIKLSGGSARSMLTQTAFRILKEYFPIGTGFGTYASYMAFEYYSPVYVMYGFENSRELSREMCFHSDTFWPIILGQTGVIGTISYITAIGLLIRKALKWERVNVYVYLGMIFIFIYFFISSTAEPTFNNAVSIPLAIVMGIVFEKYNRGLNNESINN